MKGQYIAPCNIAMAQYYMRQLNMSHFDALPFSFWPARTIKFEVADSRRIYFRMHKKVVRFCYASANGVIRQNEDGSSDISFDTGISYRGLVFMLPFVLIGLYFLLDGNLGGFLIVEGVVAINLGWAYFLGGGDIAEDIQGALAFSRYAS